MNEFELQRLYETQLTAQARNENLPHHDRTAAGVVLNACSRLLGARLRPELVGDAPDAVEDARTLAYGGDDPDGVDHNVVVRTEADWCRDLENELPFPTREARETR